MANSWYSYLRPDLDPLDASSYRRITVKPLCTAGISICSVYLLGETSTIPSAAFSANMLKYITNSLSTKTQQPVDGATKAYVYAKGN